MAQRITIAVPEDLFERLQPFKDGLNISSICQEALESVISLEEAKVSAMSKRDKAIATLKQQAKNLRDEWFQAGKKSALEWSSDIEYQCFIDVESFTAEGGDVSDLVYNFESCEWMDGWAKDDECPETFKERYFSGIVEGLMEFWSDIKNEVESEAA